MRQWNLKQVDRHRSRDRQESTHATTQMKAAKIVFVGLAVVLVALCPGCTPSTTTPTSICNFLSGSVAQTILGVKTIHIRDLGLVCIYAHGDSTLVLQLQPATTPRDQLPNLHHIGSRVVTVSNVKASWEPSPAANHFSNLAFNFKGHIFQISLTPSVSNGMITSEELMRIVLHNLRSSTISV